MKTWEVLWNTIGIRKKEDQLKLTNLNIGYMVEIESLYSVLFAIYNGEVIIFESFQKIIDCAFHYKDHPIYCTRCYI